MSWGDGSCRVDPVEPVAPGDLVSAAFAAIVRAASRIRDELIGNVEKISAWRAVNRPPSLPPHA